ncbi:hypothetical protein A3A93_04665 [Candidatus Roizmanbacteria bacterium RIFCSPLOWO2_01_FULL_38_12]|uniref:Cohesin domain-containing protein n=1 Tax=Candidatus Roizmanbacteria bacterium RIFCSPLOWO2_01_FULL_38_12 TaxID=1802061 RepID=A0A1F7IWK7_9BACT|nr:MAG: hypothetical protein A3A93_04665 [Candidatus Roizmanbacteria bacterium RIFCSPLOWO2_01_FULL_38_12]
MRKYFFITIVGVFVFAMSATISTVYAAGTLDFVPDSTSVAVDESFTVDINIDAGTDQIASTDIYIDFDNTQLEFETVTDGSYFPDVSSQPLTGRIYIAGLMENPGEYKEGSGTVAKVTFKALTEGTTTLTFDCDTTDSETSKVVKNDANATNIIDCAALASHVVTISATSSSSSSTSTSGTLPQSGVYDEVIKLIALGGAFIFVGVFMRAILRFL